MAPATTERDALSARILPQMTLSDGSESSMTGPPAPVPLYITPDGRAELRFSVEGYAIVTGGAGTLGLAASKALLEHGLSGLMIFDVIPEHLQSAVAELKKEFPEAKILSKQVNITDDVAVDAAVVEAAEQLGSIDMLLCFAGVVGCTHAIEMTAAEWRRTLDINTTGAFLCAQAVAKAMIRQKSGGSIVFTASVSAHRVNYPQPQVAYNVSKAALLTLKNCLAAEWAQYGIRVNSISPGYMDTILNEGVGLTDARAIWASRNPMGRMGMPNELTGAIVLLCAQAGSYMNGCDIVVDGGAIVF